jgi:conjugative relaxase-like TrwC/TraI family protein
MLILRPVGPDAGRYYLRGPDPGRWEGQGAVALGLEGPPTSQALRRTLRGCDPVTGVTLGLPRRHRRAGWDLIFAAPKSVSLLGALTTGVHAGEVQLAHDRAVAATMGWMGEQACWARRDGRRVAAGGVIAAHFRHGVSAAGDPHIHTHVVLANLVQGPDGRWSALDSSGLWETGRIMGPIYDLALRHELHRAGLRLRWDLGQDRTADLADVPRPAVEAASSRRALLGPGSDGGNTTHAGADRDLDEDQPGARRRELERVLTRTHTPGHDPAGTWQDRVAAAGFGFEQAQAILDQAAHRSGPAEGSAGGPAEGPEGPAGGPHTPPTGSSATAMARSDAVRALAATAPAGASPPDAWRAVDHLCAAAEPAGPGRWTTHEARREDLAVVAAARADGPGRAPVTLPTVDRILAGRPVLTGAQREAVRELLVGPTPVCVLRAAPGESSLLTQAAVLDAARSAWEESGHRVALDASRAAGRRWQALTGLRPDPPATGAGTGGVRIVDAADRRTSRELVGLMEEAARARTRLVLVEGGTLPARRHPTSAALTAITPQRTVGPERPGWHPEPTSDLPLSRPGSESAGRLPARVTTSRLEVSGSLPDAVDTLLDRWMAAPAGHRPLLVGLGPAEIEGLNRAARSRLAAAGLIGPDEVAIGGRRFAPGDQVVARRSGLAPTGCRGTVEGFSRRPLGLTVRWPDTAGHLRSELSAWEVRQLAHGYAVGPGAAARIGGPALVLGDPARVGPMRGRDAVGFVVAPASTRVLFSPDRLTQLAERARAARDQAEHVPLDPWRNTAEHSGRERPGRGRTGRGRTDQTLTEQGGMPEGRAGGGRPAEHPGPGVGRWVEPEPAGRSLAELAEQHQRLGMQLRTTLPTGADERSLGDWVVANADPLCRWLGLEDAMARRADLVTHALATDPTAPDRPLVGPEPKTAAVRQVWAGAVRAVAVHADRWPGPTGQGPQVAERLSAIRRDQTLDGLDRALGRARSPARDLDTGLGL